MVAYHIKITVMAKPPSGVCTVTLFVRTTALLSDVLTNLRANWLILLTEKTSPDNVNMVSLGLSLKYCFHYTNKVVES